MHHTAPVRKRLLKSPDELLGVLFSDVQTSGLFKDGKTVADLVPKKRAQAIYKEYTLARQDPHFDLREFVARHFYDLSESVHDRVPFQTIPGETVSARITRMWDYLERHTYRVKGSLFPVPKPYIVPGGRFQEFFYWDSYFIALGLAADGQWNRVEHIVKNIASMIRAYGFMPTANRSYFLSRSQPPIFSLLVALLAQHKGARVYRKYLPQLLQEYRWWMKGVRKVKHTEHSAYRRVVELDAGVFANRYYDNKSTPRPESQREDMTTSEQAAMREPERLFLHLRAAAESGWDFSSRWLTNDGQLESIHTADIVPVDLNCLMVHLEQSIARGFGVRNPFKRRTFRRRATRRTEMIEFYCWDPAKRFYGDYNFHEKQPTASLSLAAVLPLFAGIASSEHAALVAERIESDFLKPGGLTTTLVETGQQWDAPNGWAPLQWFAVEGLRRYGYDGLANQIVQAFTKRVEDVYRETGRIVEKYNVLSADGLGAGGEYPLQDGFGWTNGVYQAFKKSFRP